VDDEQVAQVGTLYVSPSVADGGLPDLRAATSDRFAITVEEDLDLDTRSGASASIWLALYHSGYEVLIGAAGSATWEAMVLVWSKVFKRHDRLRFMMSDDEGSVVISIEGDAEEVCKAIAEAPDLLARHKDG
jgi:hypothetical protein